MRVSVVGVNKTYGHLKVLHDVTMTLEPGTITGLLGPNGAGKSTTLHIILGLVRSTGSVLYDGHPLTSYPSADKVVGAHLGGKVGHRSRSGRAHLRMLAAAMGIAAEQADLCLELVGLEGAASRRIGGYSLGMRQRLGLAAAILANPEVLILDEPTNGLDIEGIRFVRRLLLSYSEAGKTVLVSTHAIQEVEALADQVVVMVNGKIEVTSSMEQLQSSAVRRTVVRTHMAEALESLLQNEGLVPVRVAVDLIEVRGAEPSHIGLIAYGAGIPVAELFVAKNDLEDAYVTIIDTANGVNR